MEVHDGTFELAEGEGVVSSARQPTLDRLHHGAILLCAGVADEARIALGLGQCLGIVAATVGQRVGELAGAVDRQRLEDHQFVWRDSTVISTLGNR
jgi:hypothetical protein